MSIQSAGVLDDHLGTTAMEMSSGGWPVWKAQFSPFGQELENGTTAMRYKFTGKERDAETGNDYFGARYLASTTARWMTPDWADHPEALPYANLSSPQTLNLYAYVGNNPLRQADLDGHIYENGRESAGTQIESLQQQNTQDWDDFRDGMYHNGFLAAIGALGDGGGQTLPPGVTNNPNQNDINTPAWHQRDLTLELTDPKTSCGKWLDSGGMSAHDMLSWVPIKNVTEGDKYTPSGDAHTDGLPNTPIFVNSRGRFYANSDNQLPLGGLFLPGTNAAREVIILHELAHKLHIPGFRDDSFSIRDSEINTQMVIDHCRNDLHTWM